MLYTKKQAIRKLTSCQKKLSTIAVYAVKSGRWNIEERLDIIKEVQSQTHAVSELINEISDGRLTNDLCGRVLSKVRYTDNGVEYIVNNSLDLGDVRITWLAVSDLKKKLSGKLK